MDFMELDTPALIIDKGIMRNNLRFMQDHADKNKVNLRPHTKTHKMSTLARLQMEIGATGITVAKVGEAEVMAENGVKDIFIANEIVGAKKYERIKELSRSIDISFGLDSIEQARLVEDSFRGSERPAMVLIEIEVGEKRSGVIEEREFIELLEFLQNSVCIELKGIFSHDGHSYGAKSIEEGLLIHLESQRRTLRFVEIAREMGFEIETVSIGSTPSMMHDYPILDGITEIRPGTYIFMDASQAGNYGSLERNAATVLTTVISRPTDKRVITDVGAKGLTAQRRTKGLCATNGLGLVKGWDNVIVHDVFDEHAIIYNRDFHDKVRVGDKIEIIPNHICPVVNLYETAYIVDNGIVVDEIRVDCRGKLK